MPPDTTKTFNVRPPFCQTTNLKKKTSSSLTTHSSPASRSATRSTPHSALSATQSRLHPTPLRNLRRRFSVLVWVRLEFFFFFLLPHLPSSLISPQLRKLVVTCDIDIVARPGPGLATVIGTVPNPPNPNDRQVFTVPAPLLPEHAATRPALAPVVEVLARSFARLLVTHDSSSQQVAPPSAFASCPICNKVCITESDFNGAT